MSKLLAGALLALAAAGPAAASTTVGIDSANPSGNTLFLQPGAYVATLTGGAWNAWGATFGCDAQGAHCANGWLDSFIVAVPGKPWAINDAAHPEATNYATPELAFAAYQAYGPVTFSLDHAGTVSFIAADNNFAGNIGSFTLDVAEAAAPVPEPGEWAMITAGLGILGALARKRRRPA